MLLKPSKTLSHSELAKLFVLAMRHMRMTHPKAFDRASNPCADRRLTLWL